MLTRTLTRFVVALLAAAGLVLSLSTVPATSAPAPSATSAASAPAETDTVSAQSFEPHWVYYKSGAIVLKVYRWKLPRKVPPATWESKWRRFGVMKCRDNGTRNEKWLAPSWTDAIPGYVWVTVKRTNRPC